MSNGFTQTCGLKCLLRHGRVLREFWLAALATEMEYRSNFVIAMANSLLHLVGSVFGLFLFYRAGHHLGGWEWNEVLLVLGAFTLLDGFSSTVLAPNLNRIVAHVREGTMDFVLLKPIDSQFFLSTRNLSVWGLPNVAFGLFILGYAGNRLGLGWPDFARGLLPLLLAMVILYSVWFIMAATSVWFVKIYNATFVLRSFLEAGRFPVSAYPAAYRFFFTFLLPVAFLTTVPAEGMLGRAPGKSLWLAALFAVGSAFIARSFWRFSLRFYTSASS